MLVIRLSRVGRNKYPVYRIVAAESARPVTGKFINILGHYNPHTKELVIKQEETLKYLKNGAQPSNTVIKLLKREKVKLPEWAELKTKQKAPKKAAVAKAEQPKPAAKSEAEAKEETEPAAESSATEATVETKPAAKAEAKDEIVEDKATETAPAEEAEPVESPETETAKDDEPRVAEQANQNAETVEETGQSGTAVDNPDDQAKADQKAKKGQAAAADSAAETAKSDDSAA